MSGGEAQSAESRGMRLLAQDDLAGFGNGGEGMGMVEHRGRRTLFVAHESAPKNFTAVDVTNPRKPRVVYQQDLPHARVRSNSLSIFGTLMAVAYQVASPGDAPAGIELFDVADPTHPRSLGTFDASGPHSRGAHWVGLVGERAYLATGMHDFEPTHRLDDQVVVIVDVADPSIPREIGRWWLPGTRRGDPAPPPTRHPVHDEGFRPHNVTVLPERPDRAYVAYADAGVIILDISDPGRPRLVSRLDYHPPLPGFTHTVIPLLGRGLLIVTDEAVTDHCQDHPKMLWVMDASVESNIVPLATAPLPPTADHCARGGRFGAHNVHENDPTPTSWRSETEIFGAFFNAGVRAFDVSDPFQPREIGHLVPPAPAGSAAGAIQINDVFVDARGLIYAIDRFTGGLYVIERTA
jgi:hypothetical protein